MLDIYLENLITLIEILEIKALFQILISNTTIYDGTQGYKQKTTKKMEGD